MIVQLYTMQSVGEALACLDAGADHLGLTPTEGLPGEISLETMRSIVEAVGDRARCVALTVQTDPAAIVNMVEAVRPAILHLCPLARDIAPATVAALRTRLPGLPIMQAVSVTGPGSIAEARAYAEVADVVLGNGQEELVPLAGASSIEAALTAIGGTRRTVVARLGAAGALARAQDGSLVRSAGFPVVARNAVGAGDAFNAGFVAACVQGRTLPEALRWGNAVAALKVSRPGGARDLPSRGETEALLAAPDRPAGAGDGTDA